MDDFVLVRNTLTGEVSSVPPTWLGHFPHLHPTHAGDTSSLPGSPEDPTPPAPPATGEEE